ncbi:MAG: glycoside hydrolase domain-containing protein [Bacteroidales bacterium]|nr:DUF6067 family protein [Bacteroidales bacterium]
MKKLIIFIFLAVNYTCFAQINAYELADFVESNDPETYDQAQWNGVPGGLQISWGSIDVLYKKGNCPSLVTTTQNKTVWRGEKVNFQFLIYSSSDLSGVNLQVSDLKSKTATIPAANITANFVRYTLSDKFTITPGVVYACASRLPHIPSNSILVPDIIDYIKEMNITAKTCRPVWVTVEIPRDAEVGEYQTQITVNTGSGESKSLPLKVNVLGHVIPESKNWKFHLDLWQNCVSIKRYHKVDLWSDQHFQIMKEYYKVLADAGQKISTAVINYGGQSFDDWYEPMIGWKKKINGTWEYDYTVFDKFVEMMFSIGIDKQINCYSMYPWGATRYFDEITGTFVSIQPQPGTQEYSDFWKPFLIDFKKHLVEKGWYEKTAIAMDEKLEPIMKGVIDFIKATTPDFKIALAGQYNSSLQNDIYDLSILVSYPTTFENIKQRTLQGKQTTFYTSCAWPEHPNQFTFSKPAESTMVGWFAYSQGYTGFLRWAYNIWKINPLKDTRCSSAPAGDQFFMYPGPRNSVRMSRLREGIQDYEKLNVIMDRLKQLNTPTANSNIAKLNTVINNFTYNEVSKDNNNNITGLVNDAKKVLDEVSISTTPVVTDIIDIINDNLLKIYPNPSKNELYVRYQGKLPIAYKITDLNGIIIKKSIINNTDEKLDITFLNSGNYIISFEINNRVFSNQFIKI